MTSEPKNTEPKTSENPSSEYRIGIGLRRFVRLVLSALRWKFSATYRAEAVQRALYHFRPTAVQVKMKRSKKGWITKPEGLADVRVSVVPDTMVNHWGKLPKNYPSVPPKLLDELRRLIKSGWKPWGPRVSKELSLHGLAEKHGTPTSFVTWLYHALQQDYKPKLDRNVSDHPGSIGRLSGNIDTEEEKQYLAEGISSKNVMKNAGSNGAFPNTYSLRGSRSNGAKILTAEKRQPYDSQIPSLVIMGQRAEDDAERKKKERAETAKAEGREVGKDGRPKIPEERIKAEIAGGIRYPSGKLKPKQLTSENPSSEYRIESNDSDNNSNRVGI